MKLYEMEQEVRAIASVCSGSKHAELFLSSLESEFFYDEATQSAYKRILNLMRTKSYIISFADLCSDPVLKEEYREQLSSAKVKIAKKKSHFDDLLESLRNFYQLRELYFNAENIIKSLEKDSVNIDSLINVSTESLTKARMCTAKAGTVINIGTKDDNSADVLKRVLNPTDKDLIPTGWTAWDKRNKGLKPGLTLIGGTTGGGKSINAVHCAQFQASLGYTACIIPLEMSEDELLARQCAALSSIEIHKMVTGSLTSKEKKKVKSDYKKFQKKIASSGGRLTIDKPDSDVTIEQVLAKRKPYDDDIIYIDYISLLKGVDGEDSWRELGKVARYAKVWADNNKKRVVLLVQLNDEGQIRYSKAVLEHANNAFFFVATPESKETGIVDIVQPKARNQDPFEFQIKIIYKYMQVTDPSKEIEEDEDNFKPDKSKPSKTRKKKVKMRDIL